MANGIGRLRLKGISIQDGFGTASSTVDYFISSDEFMRFDPNISKLENEAAMGSAYGVTDVKNSVRFGSFPLNSKPDENILPVLFSPRFAFDSTDNGDSTYTHVGTFSNTTQNWLTVFMQDDQRTDYRSKDVLFDSLNFTIAADGYINVAGTGNGHYPESGDFTVTATTTNSFIGVNADFLADDFGGTVSSIAVESINANHTFGLSDNNFDIGDEDLTFHELTVDRYEIEITGKLADRSDYDIYTANTSRMYRLKITDTSRTIGTGSRNPSIQFDYPLGKPIAYTDEGDLDTNLMFNTTYLANYNVDVADSPMKITVVNTVASY